MTVPAPQSRWSRMSLSLKTLVITVMVLLLAVPVTFTVLRGMQPDQAAGGGSGAVATAADSWYLDEVGDTAPTLVEFLDFECPACGSLYPYVEEVREHYRGQINYVVRYFPLGGHTNAVSSAIAVEAAGQQGKFEEMVQRMFETQQEWGGSSESQAELFRSYAIALGLDIAAYDAAVADPETEARVQRDYDAGIALGVTGTPTFFLDGKELTLSTANDLPDAIDEALAARQ